ncbi:MAG: hypothetical protein Q8M31_05430 [Beijerinckiaceae bacterium]|nr:hypothetical protein [Beijerinckiaceae bacterium]
MSTPAAEYDEEPDVYGDWSHCVRAGQPIEDVIFNVIEWHFDPASAALVHEWMGQRIAYHDAMVQFLGSDNPR